MSKYAFIAFKIFFFKVFLVPTIGTCFDILFLTTEGNENLFFKELHKMSK